MRIPPYNVLMIGAEAHALVWIPTCMNSFSVDNWTKAEKRQISSIGRVGQRGPLASS